MSLSKILLTSALLLVAAPAMAQTPAITVSKDAAAQPSGLYKLDPTHTSVVWKVLHMGVSKYTARFDKVDGTLEFNPADPTKSVLKVQIPTASVSTGNADFDKEIAGPKFLGGDKTPTITFDSTQITKTGPDTGTVTGNLTLNGVTKPVTLDVTFYGGIVHPMGMGHDIGFSAKTKFKRSDFNVVQYVPMVGDEVEIAIETEFLKGATESPKKQ